VKDLLGQQEPDPPAMTAPLEWRIYRLNDCEWWVARTLQEAKEDYQYTIGPMTDEDAFEDPAEISEANYDNLRFTDVDEGERPTGITMSFREELIRRIAAGLSSPEMFAATEY
jgi:hypothetical protein